MEGFNNLRKDSNSQDVCYSCILNLYRASLCLDRDVIAEVNRLIYQFIWKRERQKNKVKRSSLICDLDRGGLKVRHLVSMIRSRGQYVARNLLKVISSVI